ncbi:2Fe-2S iron-sulfur cluster-binding protein [Sansalvadorimonas verongulae]|uniref:2Fe-2S iron-sulfur cluster-binding protein n=1 Tax=Sansalvadorimonas verongulae TaxID=2172824 RepID=UPI0012BBBAA3|nr:2Fe-2S iron-sulfur cluster-binding protein [Sansalvadorimonas verongulae]MTI15514.1 2Fe-2S iron-sulfur cluster binding domain-containing protein [Sansalvadorimonas verongulae]
MAEIHFGEHVLNCDSGDTALDTLLKHNVQVPWSCRAGLCHSCLLQATDGDIPPESQRGLNEEQRSDGLLLACQCIPKSTLKLQTLRRALQPMQAIITGTRTVTPTLLELTFSPRLPVNYRPGQFLSLSLNKHEQGTRFTLISRPWKEADLRIFVSRKVGGRFSSWLFDEAKTGQIIWISNIGGECCYQPENQQPLIIFGAGSGISAALAIAEDAEWHHHRSAAQVLLTGDIEGHKHTLSEKSVLQVKDSELEATAETYLSSSLYRDARWILLGKAKPVFRLTSWLGEQNIAAHNILPLAYHTGHSLSP